MQVCQPISESAGHCVPPTILAQLDRHSNSLAALSRVRSRSSDAGPGFCINKFRPWSQLKCSSSLPKTDSSTMVGVPGKYRGCETCRLRRVKVWRPPRGSKTAQERALSKKTDGASPPGSAITSDPSARNASTRADSAPATRGNPSSSSARSRTAVGARRTRRGRSRPSRRRRQRPPPNRARRAPGPRLAAPRGRSYSPCSRCSPGGMI